MIPCGDSLGNYVIITAFKLCYCLFVFKSKLDAGLHLKENIRGCYKNCRAL